MSSDEDQRPEKAKRMKTKASKGRKKAPNILISGTPGTGKSTLCQNVQETLTSGGHFEIEVINVGAHAKNKGFVVEFDEQYQCDIIDEDKVLDDLEPKMADPESHKIILVEHLAVDLFPERWFDAIFVVRASTENIYDRLKSRGYEGVKLQDNIQCEIFGTILEEAKESYRPEIVREVISNTQDDMKANVESIVNFIKNWKV